MCYDLWTLGFAVGGVIVGCLMFWGAFIWAFMHSGA